MLNLTVVPSVDFNCQNYNIILEVFHKVNLVINRYLFAQFIQLGENRSTVYNLTLSKLSTLFILQITFFITRENIRYITISLHLKVSDDKYRAKFRFTYYNTTICTYQDNGVVLISVFMMFFS